MYVWFLINYVNTPVCLYSLQTSADFWFWVGTKNTETCEREFEIKIQKKKTHTQGYYETAFQ